MHEPDIVEAEFEEMDKPTVNVGTVGHCDHGTESVDPGYVPVKETEYGETNEPPKMSRPELLAALNTAVDDGHVSAKEAKRMRRDLGIFSSDFTKKKVAPNARKAKRKAKKNARRKQR